MSGPAGQEAAADLKIRDVTSRIKAYQVKPLPSGAGGIKLILLDEDS